VGSGVAAIERHSPLGLAQCLHLVPCLDIGPSQDGCGCSALGVQLDRVPGRRQGCPALVVPDQSPGPTHIGPRVLGCLARQPLIDGNRFFKLALAGVAPGLAQHLGHLIRGARDNLRSAGRSAGLRRRDCRGHHDLGCLRRGSRRFGRPQQIRDQQQDCSRDSAQDDYHPSSDQADGQPPAGPGLLRWFGGGRHRGCQGNLGHRGRSRNSRRADQCIARRPTGLLVDQFCVTHHNLVAMLQPLGPR